MTSSQGLRLHSILKGKGWRFFRIQWSPDGRFIAAPADDGVISLWNASTGKLDSEVSAGASPVSNVAWSPDGRKLAYASVDIHVYDVGQNASIRYSSGHSHSVWSLAWSPTGDRLLSGSYDRTIRVLNACTGQSLYTLTGHSDEVNCVSWTHDGAFIASASSDHTIRLWAGQDGRPIRILRGHDGAVNCLSWSAQRRLLASVSEDRTVILWNTDAGRKVNVLEGHTDDIREVAFSPDGEFLASLAADGTAIVWRMDTMDRAGSIDLKLRSGPLRNVWLGLSFDATGRYLATTGQNATSVQVWELDRNRLLQAEDDHGSYYRNAKAVLVGETGVGKSTLGFVLTGRPWDMEAGSTHGRRVWTLTTQEFVSPNGRHETRDLMLWDLAGQPDYRLIHQMHLTEAAMALVVVDSRYREDPLAGVRHWTRAIRQAARLQSGPSMQTKIFLVAAREDVGRIALEEQRFAALSNELGFDKHFRTSARAGWGIAELKQAIEDSIEWNLLPAGSTTEEFRRIKSFLLSERSSGQILSTTDDLFTKYREASDNTGCERSRFDTCIRLLEARDLLKRLSFGDLVLLQPEYLDVYAATLVNASRDDPDGMGCVVERDIYAVSFRMAEHDRIPQRECESHLLIATVQELLRHEVALREGSRLVFPSQLTRDDPTVDASAAIEEDVLYRFDGPVLTIYAMLAVRLSSSMVYKREAMWRNGAIFRARGESMCGLRLRIIDDDRGELVIFFDRAATSLTRFQFDDYVHTHLLRWTLPNTIERRRVFRCPNSECREEITHAQVTKRTSKGFRFMRCCVCDTAASLVDWPEEMSSARASIVLRIDDAAEFRRDQNAASLTIQGKRATGDYDVFLCYNCANEDQVAQVAKKLTARGILPWFDQIDLRPGFPWQAELQRQISKIKSAAVFVGADGLGPWQAQEIYSFLQEFTRRGCPVIPVLLPRMTAVRGSRRVRRKGGLATVSLKELIKSDLGATPELPPFLANMTWVDFRKKSPDPLGRLIFGITGTAAMERSAIECVSDGPVPATSINLSNP